MDLLYRAVLGVQNCCQSNLGIRTCWDSNQSASRSMEDGNQAVGGGSITKDNPFNVSFHRSRFDDDDKAQLSNDVQSRLAGEELHLLKGYLS